MGAPRRRRVIKSRRGVDEEGEEEDGTMQPPEDDSMSELSVGSDADDDADGEGSDDSGTESSVRDQAISSPLLNGHAKKPAKSASHKTSSLPAPALATTVGDTEAMMNGLRITDHTVAEEIHFDNLTETVESQPAAGSQNFASQEHPNESRRKEHEEYKRRRDADPAFVPNRGGFFMHDHRSAELSQNGFRPFGRGAMRGRGAGRGSLQGSSHSPLSGPADAPWSHDLHDTVAEVNVRQPGNLSIYKVNQPKPQPQPPKVRGPNRDFSTTNRLGDMQVRLFIHGMAGPKDFSNVARTAYTRLPYHRPPLRRDKPVRISIPDMDVKYIFPAVDRSFIFIPRALRPNQQGFGKIRGRGSFGTGYVSFGPLSSRRNSVYGGSTYTPSAILSRRSSLAREITAPSIASPSQAVMVQDSGASGDSGKPVVRLPPTAEQYQQQSISGSPTVNLPQSSTYSLSEKPAYQEKGPEDLPMHHPKPERSLQVGDIVSPSTMEFNAAAAQQQPFHQQVPLHMQTYPAGPHQYAHSTHSSHPSQASGGTPLAQIPEAAIHAQPFQPFGYPPPQGFYPAQYPVYYYPSVEQGAGSPGGPIPGQQYFYPIAVPPPPPPPPQAEINTQAGSTVAHEAGGTVYYYNPSELTTGPESAPSYPPHYSTAPAPGMEGMMPPLFYPHTPVYYPQPPPPPPPRQ